MTLITTTTTTTRCVSSYGLRIVEETHARESDMQHLKEAWHFGASGHASKMALDMSSKCKMVATHQPITLAGFEKPSPMRSEDPQYSIQM